MRTYIITGAASGIGAETALQVSAADTGLVLHARAQSHALEQVAGACRQRGASVVTILGDLLDPATSTNLATKARSTFGQIDGLVSNAGFAQQGTFGPDLIEALERSLGAMPVAFARLVSEILPDLAASGTGRVVAVSSFVAHQFGKGGMHFPATGAAKAALEALAKSLAVQVADKGITVNCVVPGFIAKDQNANAAVGKAAFNAAATLTPTGKLGLPSDVAAVIALLLQANTAQITGQLVHIDGGLGLC